MVDCRTYGIPEILLGLGHCAMSIATYALANSYLCIF